MSSRVWAYVSTPSLPLSPILTPSTPDIQSWANLYTSHIPLSESHQIPDFLTALANILFEPAPPTPPHKNSHPYLVGAYPAWTVCSTCNTNQVEPCHPYLNARTIKSTPTCDACSKKLWPRSSQTRAHTKKSTKNKNKKTTQKAEEEAKILRRLMDKFDQKIDKKIDKKKEKRTDE